MSDQDRWRPRMGVPGPGRPRPRGFTLLELMIVTVIIGIIIAFILTVAMDGVRRAQERQTQALIAKLETGISDRLEALLQQRTDPTPFHQALGAIYTPNPGVPPIPSQARAQVIANIDYIKAELPDVFYVATSGDPDASANYPINFAGAAVGTRGVPTSYWLPYDFRPPSVTAPTGFYGASIAARAALQKNVFPVGTGQLLPKGYDMVDNDGDLMVDEADEAGWGQSFTSNGTTQTLLQWFQGAHKHKTARAEVLYAVLVEGKGPLGSVFERDDFTDREVRDTDGDGLPEFVDAWGEPLQFYRWPIFYHSDLQRGYWPNPLNPLGSAQAGPYASVFEPREQNTLDPGQLLMSLGWWSTSNLGPGLSNPSGVPYGGGVALFQSLFFSLVEPYAANNTTGANYAPYYWDRSGGARRAFYSKFLIASSGPDMELGIARIDTLAPTAQITVPLLMVESQARQDTLSMTQGNNASFFKPDPPTNPPWQYPSGNTLFQAGNDDITNHNYQAPGGVVE